KQDREQHRDGDPRALDVEENRMRARQRLLHRNPVGAPKERKHAQSNVGAALRSHRDIAADHRGSPDAALRAAPPRGRAPWGGPAALACSPRTALRAAPPRGRAPWGGPAALMSPENLPSPPPPPPADRDAACALHP